MNAYDREEEDLQDQLANGEITQKEYFRYMRELRAAYRDDRERAADEARDNFDDMYGY